MKIRQLDYYTKELIEVYRTAEEAAADNYITYQTLMKAIKCNNGIVKSRKLRFEFDIDEKSKVNKNKQKIEELKIKIKQQYEVWSEKKF